MDTEITLHESTERQPFTEWLGDVLGKLKGEKLDIAALIYNRIQEEEKPKSAFQYFLENADEIDSTEEKELDQVFTATEIQRLKKKCEPLIEGVLESLLSENISTEDFYGRLWEDGICGNTFLQTDKEKIYALYRVWRDSRIPYFQLGEGMKMSNEAYMECCNKNIHLIKKAFFIINTSFSQRSQQSDLLLRVLDECETNVDKVVVMAQILGVTERKAIFSLLEAAKNEKGKE